MSGLVVKIYDLEAKLVKDKIRLVELEKDIIGRIDALEEPAYRELLTLRYVNGHKWEEIAVRMNFAFRWVHTLHGRALRSLENLL
jgi:DNA-directed RNA polymerase specialized sigma24 family protein